MNRLFAVVALVVCAACAHHARPAPLPAGQWAYRYDNGREAEYDGRVWRYIDALAVCPTSSAKMPPRRFAVTTPATWSWTAFNDAAFGSLATSSGYLFDIHCSLTALGVGQATPVYMMGFDTSVLTQPSNGTAPTVGLVSGGMSAVGNDVTYSDEQYSHGVVNFTSGFMLAVSNTADTYTAPSAGTQVQCSAKISARR